MNNETIELVRFIGAGLSLFNSVLYLYLFVRTMGVKDGPGLGFLRLLTIGIFIGSSIITCVRFTELYVEDWNITLSPAIMTINPLILLGVGLYLNYLFHQKYKKKV